MKKNKMMRLASAMMVLTLMSTSVISGTFAKYVTSDSANDVARVAKWGVTVTQTGSGEVFKEAYDGTVQAHTSATVKKLVAPGTDNDTGLKFSITGQPEVACKIDVVVGGLTDGKVDASKDVVDVLLPAKTGYLDYTTGKADDTFDLADDYYPVVYTLTGKLKNEFGDSVNSFSGNLEEIEEYLERLTTASIDANTDLATVFGDYTLTWAWDFDDSGAGTNDKADTYLGNVAAGMADGTNVSTSIEFGIKVAVTQVD